jgi:hypothetical protein
LVDSCERPHWDSECKFSCKAWPSAYGNGRLASGATTTIAGVSISYFETARTQPIHLGASALPGGASPDTDPDLRYVYARVMECLGSEFNTASFVALVKQIHAVKTKVRSHGSSLLILRSLRGKS